MESRVCQYENTSSGDFLIDRHPGFDNVWLVGGGSGHGFKHGPMVGEYVTGLIGRQRECRRALFTGHQEPRGKARSLLTPKANRDRKGVTMGPRPTKGEEDA